MMIRLDMNENPYEPPENVLDAGAKGIRNANRYSELKYLSELQRLIGSYSTVSPDRVIISPGSDFLLREVINVFSKDRKIIVVNPSFLPALENAKKYSRKLIKYQLVPPEFKLNPEIILGELDEPTLIIIDNPNNPTGKILLDENLGENILQHEDAILLINEAYYEFSGFTFADLIEKYPNVAITRTMDKAFSLAGLRLGYLLAGDDFTLALSDFPKFLSGPTIFAAIEALKNPGYVTQNIRKITDERKRVERELGKKGIEVFPSNTNFLLIKCTIPDFAERLIDSGIIITDLSREWLNDFYTISIGLPEENNALLTAINDIIAD